jgi:hypothetical protein
MRMMGRYTEEREMPRSPACTKSNISLRFDGKTLHAFGTTAPLVFPAVSGKPTANGQFDYSTIRLSGNAFLFTAPSLPVNIGFSLLSYGRTIGSKALFTRHEQPGGTLGLQSIRIRTRRRMGEEASSSMEVLQPAVLVALT